ncbi:hypothetical protein TBLA_0B07090 [Henningerozyma blattae CBS 6284]|uniref:Autophagy-related protein 20 n=1 Tax=Henningerozyma blattae (strain ATCC 34711 / CBS 6284 / DSM 70876 / NBRC 10599 / NRRL Y-10934 / UCD 77-7) TaxID=1071380 RepID=I2GZH5_HENB6|nr:hypothetical protein TBLA_0B07090 [Tetrapisispora blattae CBS 6284]CCH59527.1 hypothetical protein TBLA_0B07090 [Tetrapisispora blattae CBS 6284]
MDSKITKEENPSIEDLKIDDSSSKENLLKGDDNSSNDNPSLVHTELLQQDNPFLGADSDNFLQDTQTIHPKRIVPQNPNDIYNSNKNRSKITSEATNEDDILAINHTTTSKTQNKKKIIIPEANKVSEGQGRSFIAYSIRYGDQVVRRRYSNFESLRYLLLRLFPMNLIPPIPEKQSIKSYGKALTGSKAKYILPPEQIPQQITSDLTFSIINGKVSSNDEKLIRHRITMLTIFLNKLIQDDEISQTTLIYDFLDPINPNWNDFINSSPTFTSLPKNILQCNPIDPTNTTRIHISLPTPTLSHSSSTSSHLLRGNKETNSKKLQESSQAQVQGITPPNNISSSKNDSDTNTNITTTTSTTDDDEKLGNSNFNRIEQDYKQYEYYLKNGLYKYNRHLTKMLYDKKNDYKELSQILGDFANNQSINAVLAEDLGLLSRIFEDNSIQLDSLVTMLYYNINEPLNETVQMATSARELIKYRKLKSLQRDMVIKSLKHKESQLNKCMKQLKEEQKIDEDIKKVISNNNNDNNNNNNNDNNNDTIISNDTTISTSHKSIPLENPDPISKTYSNKFFNSINKLANKVKESINYQDIDLETQIKNLNNDINNLMEMKEICDHDLKIINETIEKNQLKKFSMERENEINIILKNYCKYMKEYSQKNLEYWKDWKEKE